MNLYVQTIWQSFFAWFLGKSARLMLLMLVGWLFLEGMNASSRVQFPVLLITTWIFFEWLITDFQIFSASFLLKTNANSMPDAEKPAGEAAAVTTLAISDNNKTEILRFQEIIWLQADNNCVEIQTTRKRFVLYRSLRSIEADLDPQQFVRIHRSAIVNRQFIQSLHHLPSGDGYVELTTGEEIRYTRNFKKALLS